MDCPVALGSGLLVFYWIERQLFYMPSTQKFSAMVGSQEITIETGGFAEQASAAVLVRQGDTVLLVTATMSATARQGIDFFPLSVDFEERMYAVGRIPGSFFR